MHSRRPPALRHKGGRRSILQKRNELSKEGGAAEQPQSGSAPSTPANNKRKRKSGICGSPRALLCLLMTLLALGLYARFVLLSTVSSSSNGLRGSPIQSPETLLSQQQKTADAKEQKDDTKDHKDDAAKEEEKEEDDWKNLVKEQTTKDKVETTKKE